MITNVTEKHQSKPGELEELRRKVEKIILYAKDGRPSCGLSQAQKPAYRLAEILISEIASCEELKIMGATLCLNCLDGLSTSNRMAIHFQIRSGYQIPNIIREFVNLTPLIYSPDKQFSLLRLIADNLELANEMANLN